MSNRRQMVLLEVLFGLVLAIVIVAARLIDHIPNVAPVAAVALLAGSYFSWPWAGLVPFSGMLVSDAFIGFASFPITVSVYGSFALTGLLGRFFLSQRTAGRIVGSSLLSSVLFYLITNAAVWRFSAMYPPTLDGLFLSYFYGLPFFRSTLLGDMAYTCGLFLAAALLPALGRKIATLSTRQKVGAAWYKEKVILS